MRAYTYTYTTLTNYHWLELPQVWFLTQQKFCHNKHVFVMTKNVFCHGKKFVATKHVFVVTQKCLLRQAHVFVATNVLSRQTCFVATNMSFVTTNTFLSWQNHVCCNKTFVVTQILLVAAPANDNKWGPPTCVERAGKQTKKYKKSTQKSLELSSELMKSGEILQTGRQWIPDSWSNEAERAPTNRFESMLRNF